MGKGINIFDSHLRLLKIPLTGLIITDIMQQSSLWSLGNLRLIDPLQLVVQVVPNRHDGEQKTFWDKTRQKLPHWTCWTTQIKSVDRFVFFRLSYFDCSDLQLFAIFMAEKLVGPRCVQIVSKRKQNPLLKLACICTICKVHSNLQRDACSGEV